MNSKVVWQRNCLYLINLFMKPILHFKAKAIGLSAFFLIISFTASAQKKSVYDVIPGSGPKKTTTSKNTVIFRKTDNRRNTYPVFTTRRKNLPPGQAKKIYGGSATDYAPGQVKKHYGKGWKGEHGKKEHGEKHGKGH
jgi:hypothetical protein